MKPFLLLLALAASFGLGMAAGREQIKREIREALVRSVQRAYAPPSPPLAEPPLRIPRRDVIAWASEDQPAIIRCPVCSGQGSIRGTECPYCGGRGQVEMRSMDRSVIVLPESATFSR
jgi:hypothetical protein